MTYEYTDTVKGEVLPADKEWFVVQVYNDSDGWFDLKNTFSPNPVGSENEADAFTIAATIANERNQKVRVVHRLETWASE